MDISKVRIAYFSPVGNVKKIAQCLGTELSLQLGVDLDEIDFTLPNAREIVYSFGEDELVVIGTPVYAGRVPNKILPFVQENLTGSQTLSVPFVSYGNRSFDDGLSELVYENNNNGFWPIAAAAVVSEHSFAKLASGRPDEQDMEGIRTFAREIADKIKLTISIGDLEPISVDGHTPPGPYYTPKREDGEPAVFLKAKPITDMSKCTKCGACAMHCPMGSISAEDTSEVPGICIKCHACVHVCPQRAKSFDHPDLESHRKMLEKNFTEHKKSAFYV